MFVIKLTNKRIEQIILERRQNLKLDANGTFNTDIDCGKVIPWHFDNPQTLWIENGERKIYGVLNRPFKAL